ncbi:MAG: peptidyl-prolyl cis-trans isomerase [Bacteroidetes bacterium]|nr:MAG: peptidyl-prolyl cis-trans isomerase [Bacteroidota bacterium]
MQIFYKHCFFALLLALPACGWFGGGSPEKKGKVLAQVGEVKLYEVDLQGLIPKGTPKADSTEMAKNYRQTWLRRQLMVQYASKSAKIDERDLERKLQEYKQDLVLYAYEKEYLRKNLDTTITDKEIQEYYEKNSANFELKQNIIKARLVKTARDTTKRIAEMKSWLTSTDKKDHTKLREFCLKYAPFYHLADTVWVEFDALVRNTPFRQIVNKTDFLQQNRFSENTENNYSYFLQIFEYKLSNQISPLPFVRDRIVSMIINQRRVQLVKKMERDIYEEGKKNKSFQVSE